jgi:capsular exopolysaccharide synthesis family protein
MQVLVIFTVTTAVNFAVMLAQQGQRMLVIDANLRRPSLHRALDLLREPGLTNLLIGDAEPGETVCPNVLPNLDFLPSGPFPPNPSELLNSKTMVRLIEEFEGRYDQVVIDSPPVLAVTDSAILAVHTDGAVIVLWCTDDHADGDCHQPGVGRVHPWGLRVGISRDRNSS